MSENETNADTVREQVEQIVAEGQDVRGQVAKLVTENVEQSHLDRAGWLEMMRSVLEGAMVALDRAVPHDRASVLRQVVDGLGDGFSTAALACKLAFEEARAQGQAFAAEDLARLQTDLKGMGNALVETVSAVGGRFRTLAAGQLAAVRGHAEQTRTRILPALETALSAALAHPVQLSKESAGAGWTASRQALGALFRAVGQRLQEAGDRLDGGKMTG